MARTKLYNRITLREHPDLSPIADATFEKAHSFIYPEDELTFCTKIIAPIDIGGSMAGVNMQSVKCSIIAKKPNIYSEEFSRVFASTRYFELDTFTLNLNNTNAPNVPWGTDGYAQNINFQQDRNFQLPSGDFKRQIKFFTTHVPTTTEWDYNFWFPIIFREEYWQSLSLADNDFYDPTQPQNGKNQKWLDYHKPTAPPFGWLIMARFELKYTVGGVTNTIYSELNLSNDVPSIQDYNSNSDYGSKSIKSCAVGGTPINSPFAPIFGYQNTVVFGYFTKNTAWVGSEASNLTAIFRIRPYEGGDAGSWNSASTIYALQTSDCWVAIPSHLIQNTGFNILTNDGNKLITNRSGGVGCYVNVTGLDIIVTSQIDYIKLLAKYSGITQFELYCRLYNGTVLLGESITTVGTLNITGNQFTKSGNSESYVINGIGVLTNVFGGITLPDGWTVSTLSGIAGGVQTLVVDAGIGSGTILLQYTDGTIFKTVKIDVYSGCDKMGEELRNIAQFIPNPIPIATPIPECGVENDCPQPNSTDCQFVLDVFANTSAPLDFLTNDSSDFYVQGSAAVSGVTFTLQKSADPCGGCVWNDVFTFVPTRVKPSPYILYTFGLAPAGVAYVDDYGNSYAGLLLNWVSVLTNYGEGMYRMKIVYSSGFLSSSPITTYDQRIFCLHQWNCFNIDGTVRIETVINGYRGSMNNTTTQIDYGNAWYGQIRLKGIFYETKPTYNKEFNQYGDADFNAFKPIIHELQPKFNLDLKPAPGWIDWKLENEILLADTINITDYNGANRKTFIKYPVMNDGGIETHDEDYINSLAWSRLSLMFGQNNLRKRND